MNARRLYGADGHAVKELLRIATMLYDAQKSVNIPEPEVEDSSSFALSSKLHDLKSTRWEGFLAGVGRLFWRGREGMRPNYGESEVVPAVWENHGGPGDTGIGVVLGVGGRAVSWRSAGRGQD